MQYSIELQAPYHDAVSWVFLMIVLFAAAVVLAVAAWKILEKRNAGQGMQEEEKKPALPETEEEKRRHLALAALDEIGQKYSAGQMDVREASLRISAVVRQFLSASGAGDAQCQSLNELRHWRRPVLTGLIAGLYTGEFSEPSVKSPTEYLRDARKLVKEWK